MRTLVATPAADQRRMDRRYEAMTDPWGYATNAADHQRWDAALAAIDQRLSGVTTPLALEVGCGEGRFTRTLALRCEHLVAVDLSAVALERAREFCADLENVRFQRWDAARDETLASYDLVTCMDVIGEIRRRDAKRRAVAAIASSVAPGGFIVVTEWIQEPFEHAPWVGLFGFGSDWVLRQFGKQSRLVLCDSRTTERHVVALFAASPLTSA
jgi:SAM-dependent methyltransferase